MATTPAPCVRVCVNVSRLPSGTMEGTSASATRQAGAAVGPCPLRAAAWKGSFYQLEELCLLERQTRSRSERRAWAALRRAGLRAVVTKALAGGLAAYLCVRERETLRLRSNCLYSKQGRISLQLLSARSPAASRAAACLGQDRFIRPTLRYSQICALLFRPPCTARASCARADLFVRSARRVRSGLRTTRNLRRVLAGHLCRAQLC